MTSTNSTTISQTTYCPCCGTVLAPELQDSVRGPIVQMTCWTEGCQAWACTTTINSILDGSHVSKWHFAPRFDPCTGDSLIQREIENLKCANNLVLICIDQPLMTAAYAEDTAVSDPMTLLSVLRDWSVVLCGKNN